MSLVNSITDFGAKIAKKVQAPQANVKSNSPVFTPAPSVETAGSVASAAPATGSFSAVC